MTQRTAHCLSAACCLSLIFLLASPALAQKSGWVRQSAGSLAWLYSTFFLDSERGWVVGSRGTLLATIDGGKTWKARPRPSDDLIRDIYFVDDLNGWLVCERNIYDLKTRDEPRTYLMNSVDGGISWKRVNLKDFDPDGRLVRAIFNRTGYGWAFGEGGVVFRTDDSGVNWVKLNVPTRNLLLGGTFIDNYRGWIVGAGATILLTSDGGETWHLSRPAEGKGVRFTAASFIDNRLGWAVGSGGRILRTINGGRSWQHQVSGVSADLLDVKFLDSQEGWAVGDEGTVLYTTDGGERWSIETSGTTHRLERIFFADRKHGWAVGFGGTIITYKRAEAPQLRR